MPSLMPGLARSEPVDMAQDVGEQVTRNDNLGHLERDVAHDLRSDLDELLSQAGPERRNVSAPRRMEKTAAALVTPKTAGSTKSDTGGNSREPSGRHRHGNLRAFAASL